MSRVALCNAGQQAGISDVFTFLQVRHRVWDSNSAFNVVLDDPAKYGFVDNTSFGQTGDFWANDFHPSSASTSRIFVSVCASANARLFLCRDVGNAHNIWAQDVAALMNHTAWF